MNVGFSVAHEGKVRRRTTRSISESPERLEERAIRNNVQ